MIAFTSGATPSPALSDALAPFFGSALTNA
jgi:hypothetical protein